MWNRISGKANNGNDNDAPSSSTRRSDSEKRSQRDPTGSVVSSSSNKPKSSRGDDRDRGFNPSSTSFSSTSRSPYKGVASASVASSYATALRNDEGPYIPPGLVRNASLANKMPKSKAGRDEPQQDDDRDRDRRSERRRERSTSKDKKREKKDRSRSRDQIAHREIKYRRHNKDKDRTKAGSSRSGNEFAERDETSRGPADFNSQVGSAGLTQFPGQHDGGHPSSVEHPPDHSSPMSSHVQDQFPGQFPTDSAVPYRPPLSTSEGGLGLAADYYDDISYDYVAQQPGVRIQSPSFTIGAEPHLQPASSVTAPLPEPGSVGGVGAAASLFDGSFTAEDAQSAQSHHHTSTYTSAPSRPGNNYHLESASAVPGIGSAAMGAAAGAATGYLVGSDNASSAGPAPNQFTSSTNERPPSKTQDSHYTSSSRPSKAVKPSSQAPSVPLYAAGAAGVPDLATAAYQHSHHVSSNAGPSVSQHPTTPMAQRHRHRSPLGAVVDFFKDSEGVAQFEEYSEIVGVCKYCFEPGSSARDAPRKHHYRGRRSNERYGGSSRIDKDTRYWSSGDESRRKGSKSWLVTGLAGYGLAKVRDGWFKQKHDFDDTYSVKSGRISPDRRRATTRRSLEAKSRRRSRSWDRVQTGITGDGKFYKKHSDGTIYGNPTSTTHSSRRRSRSTSRDRKGIVAGVALGAAVGSTVPESNPGRRDSSPKGASVRTKHKSHEHSPDRRHKTQKKKKGRGLFSLGFGSSSSSSEDLAFTSAHNERNNKRSKPKGKDERKAEAALLGLGAAAAALAMKDGRQGHKAKGGRDIVAVKETRDQHRRSSRRDRRSRKLSNTTEDEVWESASEGEFSSVDSELAFGQPVRKGSRESLSSNSSGTNRWGWQWGDKKDGMESPPKSRHSQDNHLPIMAGAAAASLAGYAMMSHHAQPSNGMDSASSLPLQHVFPVPTSDPSRFDVGREGAAASSNQPVMYSRPEDVPIQHPQPIAPVSSALYSSQAPYSDSYSAPSAPPVFSRPPSQSHPAFDNDKRDVTGASIPGNFPVDDRITDETRGGFKIRRRDTSPARFGIDPTSSSMTPRRRASAKDDSSVGFELSEDQDEKNRIERRRKRREDEARQSQADIRARSDRQWAERDSGVLTDNSRGTHRRREQEKSPERLPAKSWVGPTAAGLAGAAIGAAVASGRSKDGEETREERRERRRMDCERDEDDNRAVIGKEERQLNNHDRDEKFVSAGGREESLENVPRPRDVMQHEGRPEKEEMSVWQEAANNNNSTIHEDYGTFFTPLELRNKSSDQVKVSSANADAGIDLDRSPTYITVEPKRSREPTFSPADTDDKIDLSQLSLPWKVPKLSLVEPTPPSSRGSTPIVEPRDARDDDDNDDDQQPPKRRTPSKVSWADDETRDYTVDSRSENREDSNEAYRDPARRRNRSADSDEEDQRSNQRAFKNPGPITSPGRDGVFPSFSDDYDFAATVAAGVEHAGFDPSIIIDDPTYRRRDSPPGSNERSVPGGSEDDDKPRLSNKDRKRKDKAANRESQPEASNERSDGAVVRNMIDQVENSESREPREDSFEDVADNWKTPSYITKKSSKGRKKSKPKDGYSDVTGSERDVSVLEDQNINDLPTEETASVAESAPTGNGAKKSHRKSKRGISGFDDAASSVSSPAILESGNDVKFKAKKSGFWDRLLNKSTDNPAQGNGAEGIPTEAAQEEFEGPKKESKKSKNRRSTGNAENEYDNFSTSSRSWEKEKKRQSSDGNQVQDSGRSTQYLPAETSPTAPSDRALPKNSLITPKDGEPRNSEDIPEADSVARNLINGGDSERVNEPGSETFLGMRPEPPPPPNIQAETRGPPGPPSSSIPTPALEAQPEMEEPSVFAYPSVHTPPLQQQLDAEIPRHPEAYAMAPLHSPSSIPLSTAVPFHFRRPGVSSVSARSLSQTGLPSAQRGVDQTSPQRVRSRSMEFRSSKDSRPSGLVEGHRSRQGPSPEETYPSLPESHTTSQSSSVQDPEEHDEDKSGSHQTAEISLDPLNEGHDLTIDTGTRAMQSDLLHSQPATPTASSFQPKTDAHEPSSLQSSRLSSPTGIPKDDVHEKPSAMRDAVVGAVFAGSAAFALSEAVKRHKSLKQDLLQGNEGDLQPDLNGMAAVAHSVQQESNVFEGEEDFVPQRSKKGNKIKRKVAKANTIGNERLPPTNKVALPSEILQCEQLSPQERRRIEQQDTKDAVDSWFTPIKESNEIHGDEDTEEQKEKRASTSEATSATKEEAYASETPKILHDDCLDRGMTRDQIVSVGTAATEGVDPKATDLSQSERTQSQKPVESLPEMRQDKWKGKKGRKGRKNLQLDEDFEPIASTSSEVIFADPSVRGQDTSGPKPMWKNADERDLQWADQGPISKSRITDHSPKATPLPEDNDFDLLNGPVEGSYSGLEHIDDRDAAIRNNEACEPSGHALGPQDTVSFGMQVHSGRGQEDDLSALLSTTEAGTGEYAAPRFIAQDETVVVKPEAETTLRQADEPLIVNYDHVKSASDKPLSDLISEARELEDDGVGLSGKKKSEKGKKSEQGPSIEDSIVDELGEERAPLGNASNIMDDGQVTDLLNKPVSGVPSEIREAEEPWADPGGKKKGKKGKKSKAVGLAEKFSTTPNVEIKPQSEHIDSIRMTGFSKKPAVDAPLEDRGIQDEWDGFSKKKGKKSKKSKQSNHVEESTAAKTVEDRRTSPENAIDITDNDHVQDSVEQPSVVDSLESKVAPDEWAELSGKKGTPKGKKQKVSAPDRDRESVEPDIATKGPKLQEFDETPRAPIDDTITTVGSAPPIADAGESARNLPEPQDNVQFKDSGDVSLAGPGYLQETLGSDAVERDEFERVAPKNRDISGKAEEGNTFSSNEVTTAESLAVIAGAGELAQDLLEGGGDSQPREPEFEYPIDLGSQDTQELSALEPVESKELGFEGSNQTSKKAENAREVGFPLDESRSLESRPQSNPPAKKDSQKNSRVIVDDTHFKPATESAADGETSKESSKSVSREQDDFDWEAPEMKTNSKKDKRGDKLPLDEANDTEISALPSPPAEENASMRSEHVGEFARGTPLQEPEFEPSMDSRTAREPSADEPIDDENLDWEAPKKKKKGKKLRKSDTFFVDESNTTESAAQLDYSAENRPLKQECPASPVDVDSHNGPVSSASRTIEHEDFDWAAPKKKNINKAKKSKVFLSDQPETAEPAAQLVSKDQKIQPMQQGPQLDFAGDAHSNKSKKDKKKSKKKSLSRSMSNSQKVVEPEHQNSEDLETRGNCVDSSQARAVLLPATEEDTRNLEADQLENLPEPIEATQAEDSEGHDRVVELGDQTFEALENRKGKKKSKKATTVAWDEPMYPKPEDQLLPHGRTTEAHGPPEIGNELSTDSGVLERVASPQSGDDKTHEKNSSLQREGGLLYNPATHHEGEFQNPDSEFLPTVVTPKRDALSNLSGELLAETETRRENILSHPKEELLPEVEAEERISSLPNPEDELSRGAKLPERDARLRQEDAHLPKAGVPHKELMHDVKNELFRSPKNEDMSEDNIHQKDAPSDTAVESLAKTKGLEDHFQKPKDEPLLDEDKTHERSTLSHPTYEPLARTRTHEDLFQTPEKERTAEDTTQHSAPHRAYEPSPDIRTHGDDGFAKPEAVPSLKTNPIEDTADSRFPVSFPAGEPLDTVEDSRKSKKNRKKSKKLQALDPGRADIAILPEAGGTANSADSNDQGHALGPQDGIEINPGKSSLANEKAVLLIDKISASVPRQSSKEPILEDVAIQPVLPTKDSLAAGNLEGQQVEDPDAKSDPNLDASNYPAYSLKKSKKEKKKAKPTQHSNSYGEPAPEVNREVEGEPNALPASSMPQSIQKIPQEQSHAEVIKATEAIKLDEEHTRTEELKRSAADIPLANPHEHAEADAEDLFAPIKKNKIGKQGSKKNKVSDSESQENPSMTPKENSELTAPTGFAPETAAPSIQLSKRKPSSRQVDRDEFDFLPRESRSEPINTKSGPDEIREMAQQAKDDETWDMPVKKSKKQRKNVYIAFDEPEVIAPLTSANHEDVHGPEEVSQSKIADANVGSTEEIQMATPTTAANVELLDPQEQQQYNDEYAKELERQLSPEGAENTDATNIEMLGPLDQQKYNDEYAKELERQLSPSNSAENSANAQGEFHDPINSGPRLDASNDRLHEDQRVSPQPTILEDIAEEPSSRSGSNQEASINQDDNFTPLKTSKKSKKGKKGKKQQQPIIWEDETATPPILKERNPAIEDLPKSSSMPGSWQPEPSIKPLDLEEPVQEEYDIHLQHSHQSTDWRSSPFPRGSPTEHEAMDDYFGNMPSDRAERDVGDDRMPELHGPFIHQQPYPDDRDSSVRDQAEQEPELTYDDKTNFSGNFGGAEMGSGDVQDRDEPDATPVEEDVSNSSRFASPEKSKKSKQSKRKTSARALDILASDSQDFIGRPGHEHSQDKLLYSNLLASRDGSRQLSQSRENECPSVSEDRVHQGARSRDIGGLASAAGSSTGAVAAEEFSTKESKKVRKKDKEIVNSSSRGPNYEDERVAARSEGRSGDIEEIQHQVESSLRARQQLQHAPRLSPEPPSNYEHVGEHPRIQPPFPVNFQCRDSAIHVSDSPVVVDSVLVHRAVRDSGYPDTEASPIMDEERQLSEEPTEGDIIETYGKARDSNTETRRHDKLSNGLEEGAIIASYQEDQQSHGNAGNRHASATRETTSDHEREASRQRSKQSRRRISDAGYNSDDSADSGFDIQRRRRRLQSMVEDAPQASPVSSTTKDRSSALFDSPPSAKHEVLEQPHEIHGPLTSLGEASAPPCSNRGTAPEPQIAFAAGEEHHTHEPGHDHQGPRPSLFGGPVADGDATPTTKSPSSSDGRPQILKTIAEDNERSPLHRKDKRASADVGSPEQGIKARRRALSPHPSRGIAATAVLASDLGSHLSGSELERSRAGAPTPQQEDEHRSASIASGDSIRAYIRTPDQVRSTSGQSYRPSGTPPLRRVDRSASGDLRAASKREAKNRAKTAEAEPDSVVPSSSAYDPVTDKGKDRAAMANTYEGWGDDRVQSPISPTRPPSMRKRQSMQFADLEHKLNFLVSENRLLQEARSTAERTREQKARDHSQERHAYKDGLQEQRSYLTERDSQVGELKQIVEGLRNQVAELTEVKEELNSSGGARGEHDESYRQLESEHADTHQEWQQTTRELEDLREHHTRLAEEHEDMVQFQVDAARREKSVEIRQLQDELEDAKEQVRRLQQQILASKSSEDVVERDEDYFDTRCQALCQHVQQWVLRFSKFSDMKKCHYSSQITDEKIANRMDEAVLDGTEPDEFLQDRVKRRDIFMSVVMDMILELIFARYLFGMDREHRQKLKFLHKTLSEVGPMSAVHKWRATTLALLLKRPGYQDQRDKDTDGVVLEIYDCLATWLPPPSHLVNQIQESLRKVISAAVDLSIEMRTQRAEYTMLPSLKPQYDVHGDLAGKYYFDALKMNERSGTRWSNEELQEQHAVVQMVLFPLVVKVEDDEQIVVCPAQVLTAGADKGKKSARVTSAQGARSEASFAPTEDVGMGEMF